MAPLAVGAVLGSLVFAGAHVSGAHYNPAVSLAVFLSSKLSLFTLIGYWVVQFIGAIMAAFVVAYLKGNIASTALTIAFWPTLIGEFLFSFALCFVALNTTAKNETIPNSYFGWAIGFIVLAGAYSVGPITGAAFNPAVAVGFGFLNLFLWANMWVYFVAALIGAAISALIFRAAQS